jgi:small subunit ribosomal protein S5
MAEGEITKETKEEKAEPVEMAEPEEAKEAAEAPAETKEEIIKDIEGKEEVPETVAKKEEKIAEEMEEEFEEKQEKLLEEMDKKTEKEEPEKDKGLSKRELDEIERKKEMLGSWVPKTKLGKEVKAKKIKDIDEILDQNKKILEPEIVDSLIDIKTDLISMGQSKGKFGGGKRRAWRQTQRKTGEGNIPTFSAFAVVGDENGHVGIGVGRSMETLPARDKAIRKAKLNIIKVVRGDGSFDSVGKGKTSIPFKVKGKAGSIRIELIPAAPGTGLVVGDELKKVLKLAGIQDIYSKTFGKIRTTFNLIKACIDALKKTNPKLKGGKK